MRDKNRHLLRVKRYNQQAEDCTVAAVSSIANFYDPEINYKTVRKLVSEKDRKEGLFISQAARLLNKLGFNKISIATADLTFVDFTWAKFTKEKVIEKLQEVESYYIEEKNTCNANVVKDMRDWLSDPEYDNNLIIDNDWAKYIKRNINAGRPVLASFNLTGAFKFRKSAGDGCYSNDISGEPDSHAVVIRGYDDNDVFIADSNKYRRKEKYKTGFYKLPWTRLVTNMPSGDLILC